MASFNKVILAGHLTRDPEMRYTPRGVAVAACGLAMNRKWKTEQGDVKEEVTFVDFDCFGRVAETLVQYTRKGGAILIEGRLKLDQWEDRESGAKRSKLKIVAETVTFLGNNREASDNDAGASAASRPKYANKPKDDLSDGPPEDDDVPF